MCLSAPGLVRRTGPGVRFFQSELVIPSFQQPKCPLHRDKSPHKGLCDRKSDHLKSDHLLRHEEQDRRTACALCTDRGMIPSSSPFLRPQGTRGDAAPTPTRHPMRYVSPPSPLPPRAPRTYSAAIVVSTGKGFDCVFCPSLIFFTGALPRAFVSAHALTAAICAVSLHRRVLLFHLCQTVLLCLGLAFHACALRADRARAASAGKAPTAGSANCQDHCVSA